LLPLLTSLTRNLMFVLTFLWRHTKTHSDINRHHSERDCYRSATTQLWNTDTPSSNHTEVSVHCCHGKHTVVSSRTLLLDLIYYSNLLHQDYSGVSRNHCWSNIKVQEWHKINKKFWDELITFSSLVHYSRHRKRDIEQIYVLCIHCHRNVFTEQ
jgi:hypothetical protein